MDNRNVENLTQLPLAFKYRGGGDKRSGLVIHSSKYITESLFERTFSLESIFAAWQEFKSGKERKLDVQRFSLNCEDSLFALHSRLLVRQYCHSVYTSFYIHDPKLRSIHKACVADRVVHHAIIQAIEDLFEKTFIFDSYSSRKDKGTHRAVKRLQKFIWKLSQNNTKTVWVLKCDVKKFFDSVDHGILLQLVRQKVHDPHLMKVITDIINSFHRTNGKGIPLGNVTSQLFSNVYLNELDHYMKRVLQVKHYIRYADDFILLSRDRQPLANLIPIIEQFLSDRLQLQLHHTKTILRKSHQGIDFLGYIVFPHHIVLRTKTKQRMFRKMTLKKQLLDTGIISQESFDQALQSYLGILKHCRGRGISKEI